ncbi:MAG: hypothetical protein IK066_03485 [Kiritimatiellae bacterium]|nr:hypothetical protein [Kiritimatiellia bacterium]
MKALWIWFFCMACPAVAAMGADGDLERLRVLVENAKRNTAACRNNVEALADNLRSYSREPEFRAVQRELASSWRFALAHLDEVASDDMSKTIVLGSCWFIGEDEFGSYLLEMARLVEERKLNPRIFMLCQAPVCSPLEGALRRNQSDPAVREALEKARNIFRDNDMLQQAYDNLLEETPARFPVMHRTGKNGTIALPSESRSLQVAHPLQEDATTFHQKTWALSKGKWISISIGGLVLATALGVWARRRKKD